MAKEQKKQWQNEEKIRTENNNDDVIRFVLAENYL